MLPPPNEDTRIAELMRRVDNLESALRAAFTTISGGRGLTVTGGGGITIEDGGQLRVQYPDEQGGDVGVYFGDIFGAVTGEYLGTGLLVQDTDGTDIATFRSDAASGRPAVQLRDSEENAVMSTDVITGRGLSRPYFGGDMVPARFVDWTVSTTSDTFVTLFTGLGYIQHSGMMGWARTSMDTPGTSGEVRFLVDGVQVGSAASVPFATSLNVFGPAGVPGPHMHFVTLEIQGRITSGAGALRVAGGGWIGRPA